ncbi:hypothetical protein M0R04_04905 [Candidatus Dojkabacteria bacterium]|jgi:hypothetical protein|nr:hypothetical protein [Candidatus Dojkabacteria bacterium]
MSYREFPVDMVKESCERYLDYVKIRIDSRREKLIDKEMDKRWFFPPNDREEARNNLINEVGALGLNEWDMCGWVGGKWVSKVKDLLALCSADGSNSVFVDAEIAELIFKN